MWPRRVCAVLLAVVVSVVTSGANPPAQAAPRADLNLTVNTAADGAAAAPLNNGVCETLPGNRQCTLRAAIMKANNWHAGSVTIVLPGLPAGGVYQLTIAASGPDDDRTGDLNLYPSAGRPSVTLVGHGSDSVIDASGLVPADRVLSIAPGVTATLALLTIQGGQNTSGAGLANAGHLTLTDSILYGNQALTVGLNPGEGGGLFNTGQAELLGDEILQNTASADGAGIENAYGVMTLTNSLVNSNGTNGESGGISNYMGALAVIQTEVSYNHADTAAGISNTFGALTMTASSLNQNTAMNNGTSGGGLYNNCGSAVLVNSTVSGNYAYGSGAGVDNFDGISSCGTVLKLYNDTIAFNVAAIGGSGQGGGIFNMSSRAVEFQNTILSNNQLGLGAFNPGDCSGALISHGYNLVSSTAGCTLAGTTMGNILNQFARLRPLTFNGGLTPNHALNPNSPAVDAGNPAGCTDEFAAPIATDQRGAPRTANGAGTTRCDIGAYELQRTVNLPLVR
jgi:CSLREA domain-containing protein